MQHQHNMTCAADYYDAELIEAERLKFEAWIEGARRRRMAEKRGGLRRSARLQVCSHPVGVGGVAGTGGVAGGRAAGHRRGVCILALPLTARNQEISGDLWI